MDFQNHLQFIRMCHTVGVTKGAFLRIVYELIHDHEGTDFKDLDDLFLKLYPNRIQSNKIVQPVAFGVNINHKNRKRRNRK